MRVFIYLLLITFNLSLISGCHSKGKSATEVQQSSNGAGNDNYETRDYARFKALPKGVVVDSVICREDPTQVYSVYLPSAYDTTKKWPIIYFFDSHGAGNLPVTIYKELAEKYGYILACTYNSKNGMTWETAHNAAIAFMRDTYERFSLDDNRIYTGGFSGGAKVACAVALDDGSVDGVITCGGGFPQSHPVISQPFSCISFVGDKDFNYVGVKQLNKLLDTTNISHQLVVFQGKHQWPVPGIMEQAFQWLSLNAMRAKYIPKDMGLINSVETTLLKDAEKWHEMKNEPKEYYAYKKLVNFLRDNADVGKYAARIQQLENSEEVRQYLKDEETFDGEEMVEQQEFIDKLKSKDEEWWKNTVADMKERIKKDSTSPTSLVEQRVLSLLSLVTYMNASGAFNAGDFSISSHFVNLYAIVDPGNPEHSYLSACLDSRDNNTSKALEDLQKAVKLGFSDARRMEQDSNFVSLHNSPKFKEMVKEISSRPEKLDLTK